MNREDIANRSSVRLLDLDHDKQIEKGFKSILAAMAAEKSVFNIRIGQLIGMLAVISSVGVWWLSSRNHPFDIQSPVLMVDVPIAEEPGMPSSLAVLSGQASTPYPQHNADWTPVTKTFDGIEMVLVPAGCFVMGSDSGSHDEKPAHQQCFDEPFWIDRTEVTNKQHGAYGYWHGPEQPRENISWLLAQTFCQSRGGRLPTEAEWEYAARGPENLEYPWGNTFDGNKVVWYTFETVAVAGKPEGASWVGALDMSGSVWEWVSSVYKPYPYNSTDGREVDVVVNRSDERVLRGGSWEITDADNLRMANRFKAYPDDWGYGLIGFRCMKSY